MKWLKDFLHDNIALLLAILAGLQAFVVVRGGENAAWQADLLGQIAEKLGQYEGQLLELGFVMDDAGDLVASAPQGLLDMQNSFTLELGTKAAQIEGLAQQVAALEQQNTQLEAALATARSGLDAAVNTCITEEETPDEEQICISRSDYDARVSRFYGDGVPDGGLDSGPQ
jgi:hypothetical protein